jgi:hypothetical protein
VAGRAARVVEDVARVAVVAQAVAAADRPSSNRQHLRTLVGVRLARQIFSRPGQGGPVFSSLSFHGVFFHETGFYDTRAGVAPICSFC